MNDTQKIDSCIDSGLNQLIVLGAMLRGLKNEWLNLEKEETEFEGTLECSRNELMMERAKIALQLGNLAEGIASSSENEVLQQETSLKASELPLLPKGSRGQSDRLVSLLQERPHAPVSWLREKIYGPDSGVKGTDAVWKLIELLKLKGRIQKTPCGWEVV